MSAGRDPDRPVAEIRALETLNLDALRAAWRARLGTPPPPLRSTDLLRRALADQLQRRALGFDAEVDKALAKLARAYVRGQAPAGPKAAFRSGTVLAREHGGVVHRVEVLADGFSWNGQRYRSLSEVARAITGVRWNGPRFFGLREDVGRAPAPRVAGGRP